MVYNWNTQYENFPPGSSFGSTMGEALRRYKKASKERMEVEHEFDETATNPPVCGHKAGYCSVVEVDDEYGGFNVDGALGYISEEEDDDQGLYRDDGSALEKIASLRHVDLVGTSDDDHTQYAEIAGDELTGALTVEYIEGLSTNQVAPDEDEVLSRGTHLNEVSLDHDAGCIINYYGDELPARKFSCFTYSTTVLSFVSSTGDGYYEFNLATLSSFPLIISFASWDGTDLEHELIISASDVDDGAGVYTPRFRFFSLDNWNDGNLTVGYFVVA